MPPIVTPEEFLDVSFPLSGVDTSMEFWRQKPQTSARAVNVRGREPLFKRHRGGQREGLVRYIDAPVNGLGNAVRHLNVIVDPQQAGLLETQEPWADLGGVPDVSTNNNAAGLGARVPSGPTRTVRRGGNGVMLKRPSACVVSTRTFADGGFSEPPLSCVVQNCTEGGLDPLDVIVDGGLHVTFSWVGGGLPGRTWLNDQVAGVTGNSLEYFSGFSDTFP